MARVQPDSAGHQSLPVGLTTYLTTGHMWEATFENWKASSSRWAAFIVLTTTLIQKGSPESRRPGATELVDADPREFIDRPGVPWPVRQGGVVLWLYERSLGLTLGLLFVIVWQVMHMAGCRNTPKNRSRMVNQRRVLVRTSRHRDFGLSLSKTGKASFSRSRRRSGCRCICGSADHLSRSRFTLRATKPADRAGTRCYMRAS